MEPLGPPTWSQVGQKTEKITKGYFFWPSEVKGLLKIASWRVPGSILEASRLDFVGSGLDFQLAGLVLEGCQRSPKMQRSWPESPRSGQATGWLPSIAKPLWPIHTTPRSSEGGGAAVVPPRGFQLNCNLMLNN